MCRSIKTLRVRNQRAGDGEVQAAALQFVRKVSGYRQPSEKNARAFHQAVEDITLASTRLLDALSAGQSGRNVPTDQPHQR
jgi:hypothetical protein